MTKLAAWGAAAVGLALGARMVARNSRRLDWTGATVLITGGSRGFGLLLAREMALRGARVAISARDAEEIDRAVDDISNFGSPALGIRCDLNDPGQIERMVRQTEARLGPIDVLVNNAGIIQVGPMSTMSLEDFEEAMRVHFWAPLRTTFAALPAMKERKRGRIVNVSSIGGRISVPHMVPYSASKFALTGLSRGLRAELAKDGIYVTTVIPGLMRTGSPIHARFKGKHRAEFAWFDVADSMPGLSISAERAARRVLQAIERGEAEVVLGATAKTAVLAHDLSPDMAYEMMGVVDRLLPGPGGIGQEERTGAESQSTISSSFVTKLSQQAARLHNEISPQESDGS